MAALIRRFLPPLLALIGASSLVTIALLFFNWGYWRSNAQNLFGFDFPLVKQYHTDLSGWERAEGSFIAVYSLPDNFDALLKDHGVIIENNPPHFQRRRIDGYTRVLWTQKFPRNAAEQHVCESFFANRDVLPAPSPLHLSEIIGDAEAYAVARSLIPSENTYYGGWYKRKQRPGDSPEDVRITDYYIYILNIERRILVMFGLQT